jgi:hypothetical protein
MNQGFDYESTVLNIFALAGASLFLYHRTRRGSAFPALCHFWPTTH